MTKGVALPNPSAPGQEDRTWSTSSLPPLSPEGRTDLLGLMPAWLQGDTWTPSGPDDPQVLWEYADRHGLGGIPASPRVSVSAVSGELLDRAEARYMSNMLRFEQAARACRRIQEAAAACGVPFLSAKGAAIVTDGYDDTGVRAFEDIDGFVPDRQAALRLVSALALPVEEDVDAGGLYARIRDPGKVTVMIDSIPMEIRYPVRPLHTPFFDLFAGGFPEARMTTGNIAAPPPEWHFVFLLLHMSHHHLFARLVWFLDLAALVSRHRESFDWDLVRNELTRLNMRNAAAVAAAFCRQHIDPLFPDLKTVEGSWNVGFMAFITRPDVVVDGVFDKHHRSLRKQCYAYIAAIVHHLIVADPAATGRGWRGQGGAWVTDRPCFQFRRMGGLGKVTAAGLHAVIGPLAYMTARLLGKYTLAVNNGVS